jgi:hypothetical protein
MALPDKAVRVVDGWRKSVVQWPDPDLDSVTIDGRFAWIRHKLDLWGTGAQARIENLRGLDKLGAGMTSLIIKRGNGEMIPICGGKVADFMPWEALDDHLIDRSLVYHPVRVDETVRTVPQQRGGALRLALLIGHEGPDKSYDRNEKRRELLQACTAPAQISARIANAAAVPVLDMADSPSSAERRAFFAAADPDLVLYFGHGRAGGTPGVRIGPRRGDWLPLEELAKDAKRGTRFPESWMFLACSIGEAPDDDASPAGPDAFRTLARHGARAMLAMRSRIRLQLALIVAASVIECVSAGIPLELAAAPARKAARRNRANENANLFDWAAPAVWSTVDGPGPPRGDGIAETLVAARLCRIAANDPGLGIAAPGAGDRTAAAQWAGERRIRLDATRDDATSRAARLGNAAGAMIADHGRPAVYVRMTSSDPFVLQLVQWADRMWRQLGYQERESVLGKALKQLAARNLEGLERMLAIPGMVLIADAVPSPTDDEVWHLLERAPADTTIVLAYGSVELPQRPGWTAAVLDGEDGVDAFAQPLAGFPRTMALLCVLDAPANLAGIAAATGEASQALAESPFLVRMPGGVVLTGAGRHALARQIGAAAIAAAHRQAFEARSARPALIDSDDPFVDVRHLAGAGAYELADYVNKKAAWSFESWTAGHWIALARALGPARDQWVALDAWIVLRIAAALLMQQSVAEAQDWLDALATDDPLMDARCLSLRSEIAKAKGDAPSQERMWRYARGAVKKLEDAIAAGAGDPARSLLREMKANLARLELYFHHDAKGAADIYMPLIAELEQEDMATCAELLAATLRNLAECLFEFEPFRKDAAARTAAGAHLSRAEALSREHGLGPLLAEILYCKAKLDEVRSDWVASRAHLTEAAARAAESGHAVCGAIAKMRLFWLACRHEGVAFEFAFFASLLRPLAFCESHAWARRYAAQSRIWAAHILEAAADLAGAAALLSANLNAAGTPQDIVSDGDRRLLALSHAGLSVVGGADAAGTAWARFTELTWAADWARGREILDPARYWKEDG